MPVNTLVDGWSPDHVSIFQNAFSKEGGFRIVASELVQMLSALRPDKAWQLREELHTAIRIDLPLEKKNQILQSRLRNIVTVDGEATDEQYIKLFNSAGFKFALGEYKRMFNLPKILALPNVKEILSKDIPPYQKESSE